MHSLFCLATTENMLIIPIAPIFEQTDGIHLARKANLAGVELQSTPRHQEGLLPFPGLVSE